MKNEEFCKRQRPLAHCHVAFVNILVFLYILKLQINIKQHLFMKETFN